jgi:hypothetical protein
VPSGVPEVTSWRMPFAVLIAGVCLAGAVYLSRPRYEYLLTPTTVLRGDLRTGEIAVCREERQGVVLCR